MPYLLPKWPKPAKIDTLFIILWGRTYLYSPYKWGNPAPGINSLAKAVDRTLQDYTSALQFLWVEGKNFKPPELEARTGYFYPTYPNPEQRAF